jgi:hypothetical protein
MWLIWKCCLEEWSRRWRSVAAPQLRSGDLGMSEPDLICDLCGSTLANARLSNEMCLVAPGEMDIGPQRHQRMFEGECPDHGRRLVAFPSEGHSTLLAARIANHFTKAESKALLGILSGEEQANFRAAWKGQYLWDEGDIARWRGALAT